MNERGATAILSSKVKLGADASAAAGRKVAPPEASTDVTLRRNSLVFARPWVVRRGFTRRLFRATR